MTLEDSKTGAATHVNHSSTAWRSKQNSPVRRIPYSHARVQASSSYSLPIECNGIDLAEMALQRSKTLPARDAPYLRGGIVTA